MEIPAKQRMERQETLAREKSEEYKAAITTPSTLRFKGLATRFELRLFNLHKVWDRE